MEYLFGNEKNDRNQYEKILRIRAFLDFAFFSHYLVNVVFHLYLFSHQLEKNIWKHMIEMSASKSHILCIRYPVGYACIFLSNMISDLVWSLLNILVLSLYMFKLYVYCTSKANAAIKLYGKMEQKLEKNSSISSSEKITVSKH